MNRVEVRGSQVAVIYEALNMADEAEMRLKVKLRNIL
jgi:hypothetical protein